MLCIYYECNLSYLEHDFQKQLHQLLQAVRLIVSEIRDSMQRLDCTKVSTNKQKFKHGCKQQQDENWATEARSLDHDIIKL